MTTSKDRKPRRGLKILGIVVLLFVVLRMALPTIIVGVANRQLPSALGTEARLGGLDLSLLGGKVTIQDLRIGQPEGFGETDLLVLPRLSADIRVLSLVRRPLIIQAVEVDRLQVHVIRNKEGVLNVQRLGPPPVAAPPPAPAPTPPPALTLATLHVGELVVRYTDMALGDEALNVELRDVDVRLTDLMVDPQREGEQILPGLAVLTAVVRQQGGNEARLGLMAKLGILGTNAPAVNASVRLVGLELGELSPAVPPGTAKALGGACLDVSVDLAMSPELLDCKAIVLTAGNRLPLVVGGTPAKPEVDKSGALFAVGSRLTGSLVNLADNVGQAGGQAVGAAVDTTLAVGKGATKMVGSVGKGLFSAVKGLASGDVKAAGAGLKDSTVGAAKGAVDTVSDATAAATEGVKGTAQAGVGGATAEKWRANRAARWEEGWAAARARIEASSFPRPANMPKQEAQPVVGDSDPTP